MAMARIIRKDGSTLFCRYANSQPNSPALVKFADANIVLQNVPVSPTAEYDNDEWGIHGTYRSGSGVTPLRWKVDGVENWSDLTLLFIGDVNRDGTITVSDVTALVNIVLGYDSEKPYRFDHDASDLNGDGQISVSDVTILVNIILTNE